MKRKDIDYRKIISNRLWSLLWQEKDKYMNKVYYRLNKLSYTNAFRNINTLKMATNENKKKCIMCGKELSGNHGLKKYCNKCRQKKDRELAQKYIKKHKK